MKIIVKTVTSEEAEKNIVEPKVLSFFSLSVSFIREKIALIFSLFKKAFIWKPLPKPLSFDKAPELGNLTSLTSVPTHAPAAQAINKIAAQKKIKDNSNSSLNKLELYFLSLTAQQKIMFAKRLGQLIKAGVPILSSLNMLKKQADSKNSGYIMNCLHAEVECGTYLSSAMHKFNKIFGEFAINIVRVGEVSGTLQENLNYLAEELKKKQELKRKIIGALVYPVFIVFATIGIVILLTAYVFPKIMPIFQSFKFQLPWTTRTLIFVSNAFIHYGWFIFLGFLLVIVAIIFLLRKYEIRLWVHKNMLRIPLFGTLFMDYNIANFTRTLGLLLKSDVRIVEALQIVASTTSNLAYKQQFELMSKNITRGEKISTHMETEVNLFPVILTQMVSVGEATGGLSNSLMFLAEMYEDNLNNATQNLSTSIEPILMIFMGLLVGFIALSIITPIYGVTQNIHP